MWELAHKESWVPKSQCFWTVVLEKTLESPWDCKEIKPVNPKGNQPWIFIRKTDAEAEAPILWPPGVKSQFIGKDSELGKIEGRRRREWQTVKWLDANSMDMSLGKLREIVKDREACLAAIHRVTKNEAWLEAEQQQHFAMRGCRGRKKAGDGIYQRLRREQKKT